MARPEPINAIQAHSKAKVSLYLSDPLFVAGEHVSGKMELECKAERGLGIGDIKVELFAIQELTSRDHSATNTFLHLTRYFQGPGLPPSNAAYPHSLPGDDNVLPVNYYLARKGTTTFFFRFPLPPSSPASIDFGKGLAKLKYEVRANVGVSWRSECQRVMERREVTVAESPGDVPDVERIVVGENGKIWAQARILNPYVVAGRDACVELFVKNHSNKRTTGLSLTVARYLHLPTASHIRTSLQLSDVLATVPFRGLEYIVRPGTEGVANLVFPIPKHAQGVRSGRLDTGEEDEYREPVESLFDVQCAIEVKIGMGLGNKDIVVELPVSIFHPNAMRALPLPPPSPALELRQMAPTEYGHPQRLYSPPVQTILPYQSPPFSPTCDGYPGAFFGPPRSPQMFHLGQPVLSPPPQAISPQLQLPYDQYYYYSLLPPVTYAYPARPSSADPFVSRPLPSLPTQNTSHQASRPLVQGIGASANVKDRPEEGEPGKGESASRIAAHLRLSSRNRSASPPSHRFPQASRRPSILNGSAAGPLQVSPNPPLFGVEFPRSSPTGSQNNPELLSPRPVLTPKQSFSFDRGTVKSDHVMDLERIAAEQEAEKDGGVGDEKNNKTLPRPASPPPPFASEPPDTPRLPPEPTLHPLPTRPRPRPEIWNRESGLTALERKLLEQVGTRKPDTERRPDVRSVLPEPIKIPSPNDPRCDPPNDSAISSLALGADLSLDDRDEVDVDMKPLPSLPDVIKHGEQNGRQWSNKSPERRQINGKGRKKRNNAHHLREAASGRVAAWLGGLESASPPETQVSPFGSPAVPINDLPSPKDLDPHVLLRSSPAALPNGDLEANHDRVPTRSSGFVLHAAKDNSTFEFPSSRATDGSKPQSPYSNGNVSPSETTSVLASTSPPKPVLRRFSELQNKPQQRFEQNKYDVHSAGGGRGGKVTSVAALWASLSQEGSPSSVPHTRKGKAINPVSKNVPRIEDPSSQHKSAKTPPHTKKGHDEIASNGARSGDLTAHRAKMIKATSLPAVVSSSLAIPVLSSTASLARPIQAEYPGRSYPPRHTTFTIAEQGETQSKTTATTATPKVQATKSPPASDLAFGQARLKDLIKKYQQGFGQ